MTAPGVPPYAAYLRVYEPVDALSGPVVAAYRQRGAPPEHQPPHGVVVERARSLEGLLGTPPLAVPARDGDEAFALTVGGREYLCPWDTRLRCWVALEELRNTVPEPVLDAFLPRVVVDTADADFAHWRASHPDASPHILTSTWQVPLRWFVAFSSTERTLEVGAAEGPGGGRPRRLYYRADMADARRRVARALQVIRRAFEPGPLSEGVEELGRWLEAFHPKSIVELDYGALVDLVPEPELVADTSAADVGEALAALASGDGDLAVQRYRGLVNRWRAVGEYANAS